MKCWIAVVSREHALWGVTGHYMQACHGKKGPLARMEKGDGFLFYSPKMKFEAGAPPCQNFTGIGTVKDEVLYQVEMFPGFKPFRRNIDFVKASEVAIRPLIPQLNFIKDKAKWGGVFKYGFLEIPCQDFKLIAEAMGASHLLKADNPSDVAVSSFEDDMEKKSTLESVETTIKVGSSSTKEREASSLTWQRDSGAASQSTRRKTLREATEESDRVIKATSSLENVGSSSRRPGFKRLVT